MTNNDEILKKRKKIAPEHIHNGIIGREEENSTADKITASLLTDEKKRSKELLSSLLEKIGGEFEGLEEKKTQNFEDSNETVLPETLHEIASGAEPKLPELYYEPHEHAKELRLIGTQHLKELYELKVRMLDDLKRREEKRAAEIEREFAQKLSSIFTGLNRLREEEIEKIKHEIAAQLKACEKKLQTDFELLQKQMIENLRRKDEQRAREFAELEQRIKDETKRRERELEKQLRTKLEADAAQRLLEKEKELEQLKLELLKESKERERAQMKDFYELKRKLLEETKQREAEILQKTDAELREKIQAEYQVKVNETVARVTKELESKFQNELREHKQEIERMKSELLRCYKIIGMQSEILSRVFLRDKLTVQNVLKEMKISVSDLKKLIGGGG